jgi:type I restriction enzyme M protein
VNELNLAAEEASRAVQEYIEDHAVEEGLLEEAIGDSGKVTKVSANTRLKLARYEKADWEEIQALQHVIDLFNTESVARAIAREAQAELDTAILKQYGKLTEDDVKTLVIDDKWQAVVTNRIVSEVESLTLDLASRIQLLGERYAETVGQLDESLAMAEAKVAGHLAAMGVQP